MGSPSRNLVRALLTGLASVALGFLLFFLVELLLVLLLSPAGLAPGFCLHGFLFSLAHLTAATWIGARRAARASAAACPLIFALATLPLLWWLHARLPPGLLRFLAVSLWPVTIGCCAFGGYQGSLLRRQRQTDSSGQPEP